MATENPAQPVSKKLGALYPPTQEEIEAANSGRYAPKGFLKRALNFFEQIPTPIKIGGGVAIAAVTTGAIAIHEMVSAEEVPSVFRNSDNKGVIGDNNANRGDLSEAKGQFPQQLTEEDSAIATFLPFILPQGTMASYVKVPSDRLPTEELRQKVEIEGIKNNVDFILPKDSIVVSPVGGHGAIGFGNPDIGQDPTKAYGVAIVFYDQLKNRTYLIKMFSLDQVPLDSLRDMQRFDDKKYFRGVGWKELPIIDQFTSLMRVQNDSQQIRVSIEAYEGEEIGPEAAIIKKTLYLLTPEFFTVKDSSKQDHVFMLLQKN